MTTCGTGGWTGPQPGDPDNTLSLSAQTSYTGILVSWTYPAVNPHAVAHVKVFRGTNTTFASSVQIAIVGGSYHLDQLSPAAPTTYYYWIQAVSIHGTVGAAIGPVSAVAQPVGNQMLTYLTDLIDNGALATALKTKIDQITLNQTAISNETSARVSADSAITTSVSQIQSTVNNAVALINAEVSARTSADSSLASQITTVQSSLSGSIASVEVSLETQIDAVDGVVTDISAQYMAKVDVNGLVGGFGLYNDGATVEAGFDVTRFWVGTTSADKVKPFIIDAGVVYMDIARIRDLDITTAKIKGNAITVPETRTSATVYTGNNAFQTITSTTYVLDQPAKVIFLWTGNQNYSGSTSHDVFLKVNGIEIAGNGGADTMDYPYLMGFIELAAGTHTVVVEWKGGSSAVELDYQRMIILGAKK